MSSEEKPPATPPCYPYYGPASNCNEKATPPCYPYLVPQSNLDEYDVLDVEQTPGMNGQCLGAGVQQYAYLSPPEDSGSTAYIPNCMTPTQAKEENDRFCEEQNETYAESFEKPPLKPPCYPYLVPISNLEKYNLEYKGPASVPCPSGKTNYAVILPPPPGMHASVESVGCMTSAQAKVANDKYCKQNETYAESFEEPKMANQNSKCDGNNFIESETGYRQATQCVCAPYKSSHIHFVT